jgi:hypothetical protein
MGARLEFSGLQHPSTSLAEKDSAPPLRSRRLLSNSTKKPLFFALDELHFVICTSKTSKEALR